MINEATNISDNVIAEISETISIDNYCQDTQIIENLAAAIYSCDRDGYILSYNKAAVELWGREPEIGKDLWCGSWKIFEPDGVTPLPLEHCPMAIALKQGIKVRNREILVVRPDGLRINVMPHPDPIFDTGGKVVGGVNLLVDITQIKEKEKALKESEEKYKQLSKELEAALQVEEEFMSIASHELKTPITSIKLFIELLLEKAKTLEPDDEVNFCLTRLQFQINRLIRLIHELLDTTKIKTGRLDLFIEEFLLNDLIDTLHSDFTSISPEHTFTIHSPGKIKISADKNRIEQVISNILANAIKYSPEGSNIEIIISEQNDTVQVSIRDTGKGIPVQLIPKIFDRFFRAQIGEKGLLPSMGLGLYIVKDIITRHNGTIWVESEVEKGSTFHFKLPKQYCIEVIN